MVYYLGRDVDVGLLTETANYGVTFAANAATIAVGATGTAGKLTLSEDIAAVPNFEDVVGVDIGIGAMDEDISYFGLRSITKAEIKKETTVTITMKKNSDEFDTMYNIGRFGVKNASAALWEGLEEPDKYHGYRVCLALKSGSEVITIPNACVQSHTATINADGVTEETIEFMSYVTPIIGTAINTGATTNV
jgi:hypothetical protein|tara:strand:- start:1988 stop:2563 length:576 start_codon:yes stop_codon:yes gene_type:complete